MRHNIVPGEPGIFPAPFAKWWSRLLAGRRRRPPDRPTEPDESSGASRPDAPPETPKQ